MKALPQFLNLLICSLAACSSVPVLAQNATAPSQAAIPFAEIGAKAAADYRGEAIGILATADGAKLHTGFQKLEAEATPEGLWLSSTEEGGGRLRLRADRFGRQGELPDKFTVLPATGVVSLVGKIATFTRPGLIEEYSVSVDGVRQDFVIARRPAGAGGLRVELALSGARAVAEDYGVKITLEGSGRELAYSRLLVTDAGGRQLPATLETTRADGITVCVDDAGAVYPVRIDPTFSDANWVSLAPTTVIPGADDTVRSFAIHGTDIYVGGDFDFIGNVAARNIAKWNGSAWSALGTASQNGCSGGVFAIAAVSATEIYVGGIFMSVADSTTASLSANRMAKWNGSAWSQLGTSPQNGCDNKVIAITALSATEIYVGGNFITVADSTSASISANHVAKWNGSVWSPLGTAAQNGTNGSNIIAIAALSATEIYMGGGFSAVADSTSASISANNIVKWNSVTNTWSPLGSATQNGVSGTVLGIGALSSTEVYVGGAFNTASDAAIAGFPTRSVAKWNGSTWSPLGTEAQNGMSGTVFTIAAVSATEIYFGGNFSATADSTSTNISARWIAKWNSVTNTWSPLGTAAQNGLSTEVEVGGTPGVWALLQVSSSDLFVGGDFMLAADATNAALPAGRIARWNGSTSSWSQTPAAAGGVNSNVFAVAVSGSDLYVGGNFTAIGSVVANRVARWNGSAWSPLGTPAQNGAGATVNALAVLSATEIYVGGSFTTVADSTDASLSANRIAKWNSGTGTWSRLGTAAQNGCGNTVNVITVQSPTDVYVGGSFTTVSDSTGAGLGANRIAKWDGSAWSRLGTTTQNGCNGSVNAIAAVSANEIYIGGSFTTVSDSTGAGLSANRIAKWDGSAWSRLGTATQNGCVSTGSTVNAIAAASPTDVYVGGSFSTVADSTAASIAVRRIARWNGSAWSRLGSASQNGVSTSGTVNAIAVVSASEIYVGGKFTFVSDTNTATLSANRIARWNGTDWAAVGGGVSGTVRALAVDGAQNVILGGDFLTAGASPRILSPFLVALQEQVPEIAVEQPAATNLAIGAVIGFSPAVVGGSTAPKTFTIKNTGAALTLTAPVTTGGNAGDFVVNNTGTLLSIPGGQETTFAVTFTPTAGGSRTTTLRIPNNDPDENPFDITLNGTAYDFTTDTDLDGLNDATEFQMAALGFDPAVNQTALVNTLFGNLGGAQSNLNAIGYFTTAQVQALHVDTPLIQRNPGNGVFTLTLGLQKSTNLALPNSFLPFSFTAPETSINGTGKIEFQFTSPDNAAFFRLQAE